MRPSRRSPSKPEKPAKPETLRLVDDGNPTVFVKLKETVDLYDEPGGEVVETVGHSTDFGSRTVYAVTDQKDDWGAVLTPYTENGEPLWLKLDPERLKAGRSIWNLEVDLSEFETRLYKRGKFVRSFPVSIGMPTAPTPTGRFAITDTFRGGLNAGVRLLRPRDECAPGQPAVGLARRRPDRLPRHQRRDRRRDLARLHPCRGRGRLGNGRHGPARHPGRDPSRR